MSGPEMQNKTFRILIVDTNKVYAKMVKDALAEHVSDCQIDISTNIYEMRRRISSCRYDLVLADLVVAYDGEDMQNELRNNGVPTIVWSSIQRADGNLKVLPKPVNMSELENLVPALVTR